jgi:hypothetical protein
VGPNETIVTLFHTIVPWQALTLIILSAKIKNKRIYCKFNLQTSHN